MANFNKVILAGNLTRDPELRYTPNGQAVASFSVATNRRWTDQNGEKKDAAEFTDVVVWGKLAETVSTYMKKGRRIHVIGRLQTRSWEAQDGSKRSKTEVVATDVTFLDKAAGTPVDYEGVDAPAPDVEPQKEAGQTDKKSKDKPEEEISIEDIPF